METQELHRGRLIDHLQLVVRDLAASRRFYSALLELMEIPLGGSGEGYFWYKTALAHGGRDNGAPGEREYHPDYYAAFVLDPDGNNIKAVFHGKARRSAASVTVTF